MRSRLAVTFLVFAIAGCGSSVGEGGGPTPTVAPTPTATPRPRLFALVAANYEFPDTQRARLLSSDDLGVSWQFLDNSGLADTAVTIAFADRDHGVAAGATLAQQTDDGGATWTTQLSDDRHAPDNHLSLDAVSIDRSGAAVLFGSLLNDGYLNAMGFAAWLLPANGSTAQAASIASGGIARVDSVCVSAGGFGVAAGTFFFDVPFSFHNTVFITGDAGASWTLGPDSVVKDETEGWGATACSGSSNLWLFGGSLVAGPPYLTIAHSADGGATWVRQGNSSKPIPAFLRAASFVDDRTGWAVGQTGNPERPIIVHTSDGGDSWEFQTISADIGDLGTVAFLDENLGIAGGQAAAAPVTGKARPLVLITEDGGSSWRPLDLPVGADQVLRVDVAR